MVFLRCIRIIVLTLAGGSVLCALGLRGRPTQSNTPRRLTNTSETAINLNPTISGDGRVVVFETTEDLAAAGGQAHFRAMHADVSAEPPAFMQMGNSRAVAPASSQDGSRIAFASTDDLLGTNADGNSVRNMEIM
jgi:Tol biopolymer transport system component